MTGYKVVKLYWCFISNHARKLGPSKTARHWSEILFRWDDLFLFNQINPSQKRRITCLLPKGGKYIEETIQFYKNEKNLFIRSLSRKANVSNLRSIGHGQSCKSCQLSNSDRNDASCCWPRCVEEYVRTSNDLKSDDKSNIISHHANRDPAIQPLQRLPFSHNEEDFLHFRRCFHLRESGRKKNEEEEASFAKIRNSSRDRLRLTQMRETTVIKW